MVTLFTGPMFSGKSTKLMQQLERDVLSNKKVILIRPKIDDRGMFSHSPIIENKYNKITFDQQTTSKFEEGEPITYLHKYDSIFVDEFFMIQNAYIVASVFGWSKDIYYSGLLASAECEVFEEGIKLLPYCDNIKKFNGVCTKCGSQLGNYSFKYQKADSPIAVGGKDEYTVLCQKCYEQKIWERDSGEFLDLM